MQLASLKKIEEWINEEESTIVFMIKKEE